MSRWFRWYEGTTEDAKFRVVARNVTVAGSNASVTVRDVLALWACILEDASKDDHRGVCQRDANFVTAILDFADGVAQAILAAMEQVGMITINGQSIKITHWEERQFETDKKDGTNALRQRRFRAKKRNSGNTGEKRQRNAENNGGSNGTVTPPKTVTKRPETEQSRTRTEQKENYPLPLKEVGRNVTGNAHRNGAAGDPYVWINTDDPRWPIYVAAYRAEKGKDPPTTSGLNGMGWHFAPLVPA